MLSPFKSVLPQTRRKKYYMTCTDKKRGSECAKIVLRENTFQWLLENLPLDMASPQEQIW